MDKLHKECLLRNRPELVDRVKIEDLWNELLKRKMVTLRQKARISHGKDTYAQTEELLDLLPRLGPNTFKSFCEALEASNQADVVHDLLRPGFRVRCTHNPTSETAQASSQGPTYIPSSSAQVYNLDIRQQPRFESSQETGQGDTLLPSGGSEEFLSGRMAAVQVQDEEDIPDVRLASLPIQSCSPDFYEAHKKKSYPISHPRGAALIINVLKVPGSAARDGTDIDRDNLKLLWEGLGFIVRIYNDQDDLSVRGIEQKVKAFAADPGHAGTQCAVVCLLSHGEDNHIFGTDGNKISVDALRSLFNNVNCPNLAGKPKLFFVQACRGGKYDAGTAIPKEDVDMDVADTHPFVELPSTGDFITAFPTQKGYFAWRNTKRGSWFVQALIKVFSENAHDQDICSMLNQVNCKISTQYSKSTSAKTNHKFQMSEYVSSLTRAHFFFFPGI